MMICKRVQWHACDRKEVGVQPFWQEKGEPAKYRDKGDDKDSEERNESKYSDIYTYHIYV